MSLITERVMNHLLWVCRWNVDGPAPTHTRTHTHLHECTDKQKTHIYHIADLHASLTWIHINTYTHRHIQTQTKSCTKGKLVWVTLSPLHPGPIPVYRHPPQSTNSPKIICGNKLKWLITGERIVQPLVNSFRHCRLFTDNVNTTLTHIHTHHRHTQSHTHIEHTATHTRLQTNYPKINGINN